MLLCLISIIILAASQACFMQLSETCAFPHTILSFRRSRTQPGQSALAESAPGARGAGQALECKTAKCRYSYQKRSIPTFYSSIPIGARPGNCESIKILPESFLFLILFPAHITKNIKKEVFFLTS